MSAQDYWSDANPNLSYSSHNQQQHHGQNPDTSYPTQYGQNQPYQSHQQPDYNQDHGSMNWGYGSGGDQIEHHAPPQQQHNYYDSSSSAPYNSQQNSTYDQHQGYNQSYQRHTQTHGSYQSHSTYDTVSHSPQSPQYSSHTTDMNRQTSPNSSYYTSSSHYPTDQSYNTPQTYPGAPSQVEGERGLLGAIGGAAAGGFAGHKVNHGFIGAIGGAYAGHKLEDKLKEKKKKDKQHKDQHSNSHKPYRRGSSSSSDSSSNSSDDEKKKNKKKYGTAAVLGGGAYAVHQKDQGHHSQQAMAGNFSGSSTQISLDRDYDLIASCATVRGSSKLSSISLNDCLINNWGQLKWSRGGGFGASSRNVRLVDGGRVLEAELGDGKGGWNVSRIRLDERITNNDGDLQFLG